MDLGALFGGFQQAVQQQQNNRPQNNNNQQQTSKPPVDGRIDYLYYSTIFWKFVVKKDPQTQS